MRLYRQTHICPTSRLEDRIQLVFSAVFVTTTNLSRQGPMYASRRASICRRRHIYHGIDIRLTVRITTSTSIRTRRSEVPLHAPDQILENAAMQKRLASKTELVVVGTIVWRFLLDETIVIVTPRGSVRDEMRDTSSP